MAALFSILALKTAPKEWRVLGRDGRFVAGFLPSYMKKKYRLKSRVDFQAVYTKGRSTANRAAVVYVLSSTPAGDTRVGFAAGKKLGKAVVRNRIKRRIKEAVRVLEGRLRPGLHVVVIARQSAKDMPFTELQAKLEELFNRAGLLLRRG